MFNISAKGLVNAIRQDNYISNINEAKEEAKLSLFANDMII